MMGPLLMLAAAAAAPDCAGAPSLPVPWTSWTQSWTATAGTQPNGAPSLLLGKPFVATLSPADYVQFAADPGKDGRQGFGGIFTLSVRQAARIGIALSGPAWVDVVSGTVTQPSVDHGHGPDCSGIRKIVWFDLPLGRHVVQIAGSKAREIRVMAADAQANQ